MPVAGPAEVTVEQTGADRSRQLLRDVAQLINATCTSGEIGGASPFRRLIFGQLGEAVSVFESVQVLLDNQRPVEAAMLLPTLVLCACRFEHFAREPARADALAVRFRLDALRVQQDLSENDDGLAALREQERALLVAAADSRVEVPEQSPNPTDTRFCEENRRDALYCSELAQGADLAASLHMAAEVPGELRFSTQLDLGDFAVESRKLAAAAVLEVVERAASLFSWPLDQRAL